MLKKIYHNIKNVLTKGLSFNTGGFHINIDASVVLLTPIFFWGIAVLYVPVMGTGLSGFQPWAVSLLIIILMFFSIFVHSFAHICFAGNKRKTSLKRIYFSPLGDPAHSQQAAPSAGKEALTAAAGPLAQTILALLFYYLWNLQINTLITTVTFFLMFYNLGLAALNVTPAFPYDGGRLLRASLWGIAGIPGRASTIARVMGWIICAGLLGWAVFLIAQQERFSLETSAATLLIGGLTALSLMIHKEWKWSPEGPERRKHTLQAVIRTTAACLLILPLLAVTISLLPLNKGLEAPGFTASVKPMIELPGEYRFDSSGDFILLTVIPQAPIIAGEWFYAQFDRSIKLVTPEQVIPQDKTAQTISAENYQMLLDSKTVAVIVALKLAGFQAEINHNGVAITSIMVTSPAYSILQTNDIITEINRNVIITPEDLSEQLKSLPPESSVNMKIRRGAATIELNVPTLPPETANGPVRIGISVAQYDDGFSLPFPVNITPQKVNGGPSAGLIFTLAVYDLITEGDLTGGRIIAGTGTINLDGSVGPIGKVQQKVVAAERAGAKYFLSPGENYQDALAMAKKIKVIKVTNVIEAIQFLQSLPPETEI